MRSVLLSCALAVSGIVMNAQTKEVRVVTDEAHQRVNVTVDGAPFTSYLWGTAQKKPVLYPLIAPSGIEVSRGYPLAPREGERTDHPHHAGMWFSYGNVDGFDCFELRLDERSGHGQDGPLLRARQRSGRGRGRLRRCGGGGGRLWWRRQQQRFQLGDP